MISKSTFVLGHQCEKSFWFKRNRFPETNPSDDTAKERLSAGQEVGEISKMLFPGGEEIPYIRNNYQEMFSLTLAKIANGADVLYEASFIDDGIFIRVDLMKKTSKGWDVYEVKSSSSIKDYHKYDASLQWYVLNKIPEVKLNKIHVIVINNKYEKNSEIIPHDLFKEEDVTDIANENLFAIEQKIAALKDLESNNNEPAIDIGSHCKKPHGCVYLDKCWPKNKDDLDSVFTLYRLNTDKKINLFNSGIDTFDQIQDESSFSNIQQIQLKAYQTKKPVIDKKIIIDFVKQIKYPISYFDFETFTEAVPTYNGQRPHMQMPFQYSLHIQHNKDEKLKIDTNHFGFLSDHEIDPRRSIAERMIKHFPSSGTIMAYNQSFEKQCIESLARHCPDLADTLLSFNDRFADLIIPFRSGGYYDSNFRGSFSIKRVLPALCPANEELNYQNLEISNGGMASTAYKEMRNQSKQDIEKTKSNLFKYCRLDTYAMYAIYSKLLDICT
jgi:hypothetical protein